MITAKINIIEATFYCKNQLDFDIVIEDTEEVYDNHMDVHIQYHFVPNVIF